MWSTLPSSKQISGGRFVSRIYEGEYSLIARIRWANTIALVYCPTDALLRTGKFRVDDYIREKNLPASFLYTGNFYENMILRSHIKYDVTRDTIEFHQPVIRSDTKLAMLFVEKDLSGIAKAVFDQWDDKKKELSHQYLYCADARRSPDEILNCIERISGKQTVYKQLGSTGWPDRDIMFELYNECGMYGGKKIPDENVLALGVDLHGIEDFVRERLLPHLGLAAVDQP